MYKSTGTILLISVEFHISDAGCCSTSRSLQVAKHTVAHVDSCRAAHIKLFVAVVLWRISNRVVSTRRKFVEK